jgi:UDP-N-acetylmuramyl pentapeptide phosphotransferase/UDP-N-acetylglucosamine-1-phosphate transferase
VLLISKVIIAFVAIVTIAGAIIADVIVPKTAKQHIFNPKWTPHAKFHNGQTIALSILLGLLSLYLLFRSEGDQWFQFILAVITASYYWISMIFAAIFPHTGWIDDEFKTEIKSILGLHPQQFLAYIMILLLFISSVIGYLSIN